MCGVRCCRRCTRSMAIKFGPTGWRERGEGGAGQKRAPHKHNTSYQNEQARETSYFWGLIVRAWLLITHLPLDHGPRSLPSPLSGSQVALHPCATSLALRGPSPVQSWRDIRQSGAPGRRLLSTAELILHPRNSCPSRQLLSQGRSRARIGRRSPTMDVALAGGASAGVEGETAEERIQVGDSTRLSAL